MRGTSFKARERNCWRLKYDLSRRIWPAPNALCHDQRRTRQEARGAGRHAFSPRSPTAWMSILRSSPSPLICAPGWMARTASPARRTSAIAQLVEQQIIPHLGAMPLQKLRPAHIADWHAKLLKAEGRAVGRYRRGRLDMHIGFCIVASSLRCARELIARNVASAIAPPKVEDVEVEALKADEIAPVLEALRGTGSSRSQSSRLTQGHDAANCWRSLGAAVDLQRGHAISRSLEQTRAGLSFKQPKTKSGRRRDRLAADRRRGAQGSSPPSARNEDAARPRQARQRRVGVHHARRSADAAQQSQPRLGAVCKGAQFAADQLSLLAAFPCLMLISSKLDPLTVARRVGHANPTTTMRVYAHMWRRTDSAAADAVEAALRREK